MAVWKPLCLITSAVKRLRFSTYLNLSYLQVSRDENGNLLFVVTWTRIIARVSLLFE